MLRRLLFLGALLLSVLPATAGPVPGQPARFDLGADVRGLTFFHRDTTVDMEWDFAVATSDGIKILETSATAPGGYIVYTLVDPGTGQSTAGQDVVAIANPDTDGTGFPQLAWLVRSGGRLKLWCAHFEGAGYQFPCTGQGDFGGGGAGRVIAAAGNMDVGTQQDVVVVANGTVYVALSVPGGGFGAPVATALTGPAAGLAVGEFSGDGLDDVAVTVGTQVVTFASSGAGSLGQLQVLDAGVQLGSISAGKFDTTGVADLAVAYASSPEVQIINGGTSIPPHSLGQVLAPFPSGLGITQVSDLTLDDSDADGDDDLAIAADGWVVLESNGAGSYMYGDSMPGLEQPLQIVATNGHQDLGEGGGQSVMLYRRSSGGSFFDGENLLIGRGALPSQAPEARVVTGSGAPMGAVVRPYAASGWGTRVAAGNVSAQPDPALGRDVDEAIFGPGPGAAFGPQVRAYRPPSDEWVAKINFYAYGSLKFGVNVDAGDLDGIAADEIVTGAGAGAVFGPHVRAFRLDGSGLQAMPRVSFFAYSTLKYGVNTASGDIDGDVAGEVVTGPGPGAMFSPQVRGWNFDGSVVTSISRVNFNAYQTPRYGARVAVGDFDRDAVSEIVASPGPGGTGAFGGCFRGFDYDGVVIGSLPGFDLDAAELPSLYGAVPGALALDPSNAGSGVSLAGAAGPQPGLEARVMGWAYDGAQLRKVSSLDVVAFGTAEGGANLAAGEFY